MVLQKQNSLKPEKQRSRPSLSTFILIGLVSGIATGLFFGEYASNLKIIGQAYVGLLQMSILPYMMVSLIGGIGHLNYSKAKALATTGGVVLIGSWLVAFFMVFVMPLAFPESVSGSFFSPTLVETTEVDFIDLYVPVNPFSSMARTVVPAVAVFSVASGIALIGIEKKQHLLDVLATISETLTRVAMMVVKLTPIGVFAIAANATGTLTVEEFGRLQTYIVTFIVATLVLTFWVLPGAVTILTPFSYREVFRGSRDALVTGFVTGNLFIVLPLLIENGKKLFAEHQRQSDDTDSYVEVLVPTSFNFPNIAKLLTLLFVLFAGWFTGNQLDLTDYPRFSILGLFTLFGGVDLALPFLLDQLRIPSDMYQLYVVTGVINGWFATLLAVMNLFAFTLVATCAATTGLTINWRRIAQFGIVSAVILVGVITVTRIGLSVVVGEGDIQRETLMQLEVPDAVPARVYHERRETEQASSSEPSRLSRITESGVLRVGYRADSVPFSFFNGKGQLVGYDVELVHRLAAGLGVTLDFIPWEDDTLYEQARSGEFDLVIGGLVMNTERSANLAFSQPYMTVTAALVVRDHLRNEFPTWDHVNEREGLTVGLVAETFVEGVTRLLPDVTVVVLGSDEEFFDGSREDVDAVITTAEDGSAWTVIYPRFAVAIPTPHYPQAIGLAIPKGDPDFITFINNWLTFQATNEALERLYEKWILGKSETEKTKRWPIIRNVLHWVE